MTAPHNCSRFALVAPCFVPGALPDLPMASDHLHLPTSGAIGGRGAETGPSVVDLPASLPQRTPLAPSAQFVLALLSSPSDPCPSSAVGTPECLPNEPILLSPNQRAHVEAPRALAPLPILALVASQLWDQSIMHLAAAKGCARAPPGGGGVSSWTAASPCKPVASFQLMGAAAAHRLCVRAAPERPTDSVLDSVMDAQGTQVSEQQPEPQQEQEQPQPGARQLMNMAFESDGAAAAPVQDLVISEGLRHALSGGVRTTTSRWAPWN